MDDLNDRDVPLEMSGDEFRRIGHQMIDAVGELLDSMRNRKVSSGISPDETRAILGAHETLPEHGMDTEDLLSNTSKMLFDHSLYNGHPRFWGYITSSPAPIGILGDMLAAAVNSNVGAWKLSPMATEIEAQTVRWIAELIGYPPDSDGLLVSGGTVANYVCLLAARAAKADYDIRKHGLQENSKSKYLMYASSETHTWIMKAADLFGFGTDAIRWVKADTQGRMIVDNLRSMLKSDLDAGHRPFLVIGSAGTVSTGAIDPLRDIAKICDEYKLWFHVDGAYGGFAAAVPGLPDDIYALSEADSVAVDPHKWLYTPLEAGCVLIKSKSDLLNAFSYHPPYYQFGEEAINYFDLGIQNSRGFRALKVWLALKQIGRNGYRRMIADDIDLAQYLYMIISHYPEFEAFTHDLSIVTFRYVPEDLKGESGSESVREYLNNLNQEILFKLETGGEAFLSNAVIDDIYLMRACIVNFRTTLADIEMIPDIILPVAKQVDASMRKVPIKNVKSGVDQQ
jgi:aromatic-L-amino-acid decarboxylase